MTSALPVSAALAWWGTAWLRGTVGTDHLLDHVAGRDEVHPGLVDLLATFRRSGATSLGLALPVEGDPLGLGGPAELNVAALEAGEAVVAGEAGVAAVPVRTGDAVTWSLLPARRRSVPDVGEADRGLRGAVLTAARTLAELDVARWRPEVADALMDLRHLPDPDAPAGTPGRCVELAARGLQALGIVELARTDEEGGAVSAAEMARRHEALVPLERAGRRGVVAACSPEAWPDH